MCVKLHKWLTENDHIDGAEPEAESDPKAVARERTGFRPEVAKQLQARASESMSIFLRAVPPALSEFFASRAGASGRYLEPPEGFDGLTGDDLYEAQAIEAKSKSSSAPSASSIGQVQDEDVGKHPASW